MRRIRAILLLLALPAAASAEWWDGFGAPPAGQGLDGDPRALHVHDDDLYAGGSYLTAGGDTVRFVARWDGAGWHALAGGANNRVDALLTHDGDLVAGGRFTVIGGVAAPYVAAWDGQAWSAVGAGSWSWGYVLSLAVHQGKLYAGGTGYVATFDGVAWQAITGPGFTGDVFALASFGTRLHAGGAFAAIPDPGGSSVAAANVASWDGSGWSALGAGTNGTVYALLPHGGDLAAGGVFTTPGSRLAAWTGGSWYAVGGGLADGFVIALADWGGRLVAGGDFSGGGSVSMTRIGVFDGDWSPLGSGLNAMPRALAARGAEVFAGGAFTLAGGQPSARMALWTDPDVDAAPAPPAVLRLAPPFPNPANPGVTIPLRLEVSAEVDLAIHDLAGRRVRTLRRGVLPAGDHALRWDGRDDAGRPAPAGAYVARARSGGVTAARRLSLVK